ncbi:MAG TPA: GlsB/YeaQ/YmgE family stress response membrane protein [Candidatus Competibacteraceae bacterium]|nr:MAG: GlsB/YeaQ/YmgE family stress response membrane protein [Candidatus Competibacteraceae bacterium]HOB62944.1 GlsB/YeaQ/YmgE family stress response membrane protein [Candidatus Competibacteraceae bacterium]HQA27445.1 GlsB/YeaQ/YmgE family stress response membrane protein [Candidatus Competibacteraceae bacterium]HQD57306.1 GlsB/YeaQ/YmgE family stress response membrane protein [Candidatus Competibacteraceae bacterium]
MDLIGFLLIGLIAGWIATNFMRGSGMGLGGNLVIGVIGAFVGGFLFRLIGFAAVGLIGHLVTAVVGAVVLLYVVQILKRA